MVNYQNGKIYTIRSYSNPELVYVGSTAEEKLSYRWSKHKYDMKTSQSKLYQHMRENIDDFYIELYELYPCSCKEELLCREGTILQEKGFLNQRIETRTFHQYYMDNKEKLLTNNKKYREENKERYLQMSREYYRNNKEEHSRKVKIWRENNKEKKQQMDKQYRENNKEKIAEYLSEYQQKNKEKCNQTKHKSYCKEMLCECGETIKQGNRGRHILTKRHLEKIENEKT